MAQGNDVVDLTGLAADKFLESAVINGSDLILTMNDGEVLTVDLSFAPDIYLDGAVIDQNNQLLLTMNDGTTHTVDLSAYATVDTYVQSAGIDGLTGVVTLSMNDGTLVTFDISGYVTNADVQLSTATYNCATNQIELIETDGNTTIIDMTCFVEYLSGQERGGVAYNAGLNYVAGDVATVGGVAYISLTGASTNPALTPSDWALVSQTERGGSAWNGSTEYLIGDVVTKNNLIYIAQAPSQGVDPVGNGAQWREYNSVWHVADAGGSVGGSLHNPTLPAVDSYPDATTQSVGAMWYIDGLGDGVIYTYTAGTLAGIGVRDRDRLIWASGDAVSPDWVHVAAPVISAERGGIAWSSTIDYTLGDMVIDPAGYAYKCIQSITANPTTPAADITNWVRIVRTGDYDSSIIYVAGDIATYNGDIFIAPVGGIGPNVEPGTGAWIDPTIEEKGGIAWNATASYDAGDMVSDGTLIYTAIQSNNNRPPSSNPADWLIPSDPSRFERGGILWDVTLNYVIGDMVTSGAEEVYVALTDNVGLLPESNLADWKLLTKENGGIAHDATTLYIKGDIVSETIGAVETIFIAKADNNGVLPSSDPATWDMVISATTYVENGGVEWQSTITYNAGDIITEFAGSEPISYVARVPNINALPSLNLDTEWQLLVPTEVGGRDWNLNLDYLVGDIVTEAGIVYRSVQAGTNNNPAISPSFWQVVTKGGTEWFIDTNYDLGDLVTENGTTYIAIVNSTGLLPSANPVEWQAVNGSGEYDPGINYKSGDIVSYGGVVYLAITDNLGSQPDTNPTDWQRADRGGELWDATTNYRIGDIATLFDKAYVAKTVNTGSTPVINGDTADWKLDVVTVEDNLVSTSAINALSANMGRDLEDRKIEPFDYGTATVGGTAKFEWDAGNQILNIVTV